MRNILSTSALIDYYTHFSVFNETIVWVTATLGSIETPGYSASHSDPCMLFAHVNELANGLLLISYKVCQSLFGDYFFILWFYKLKLAWYVSSYVLYSGMKLQLDPTKNEKKYPWIPIVKITHFSIVMSIDMALLKWAIFTMEYMGKFFVFCRIELKFRFRLHKNVGTYHEMFS